MSTLFNVILLLVNIPIIAYADNFTGTWERNELSESGIFLKTQHNSGMVRFQLEISRGAPSHNSGFLKGEFVLQRSKGVFYSTEFGDCEISFSFESNSVQLEESNGKANCGFGYGVHANGELTLISKSSPKFSNSDPRAGGK